MIKFSNKIKYTINKIILTAFLILTILGFSFLGYDFSNDSGRGNSNDGIISFSMDEIPDFNGSPYVIINNNVPFFTEDDFTIKPFEVYSELDSLGRCGVAYANICREIMPTTERGEIGMIKPSGWQTVKYDSVDGKYLYNRCHLIGFQLAGENANTLNLITGTRYMNTEGMLPFENMIDDYVDETGGHVLYRVTPVYIGDNLLATGVELEAWSVEDGGDGICFNVFVYNSQPGIKINYANGKSEIDENYKESIKNNIDSEGKEKYIINTNTKKFHIEGCNSIEDIHESNRLTYYGAKQDVIMQGFEPCKACNKE